MKCRPEFANLATQWGAVIALCVSVSACSDPNRNKPVGETPAVPLEQPAFVLPLPQVVMAAEPPPPFTYWAPEGSTIRNHPNVPGLWLAEMESGARKMYFGDACGASSYQHLVGQTWQKPSTMPPASEIRTFCTTCPRTDDLRPGRMNVTIDEARSVVTEIACF
jgi:hypothetical protein